MTRELSMTRWFDAAPEIVYRAFADPAQVSQWWGPLAYHVPHDGIDLDVRTGGHVRLTMVSHLGLPDAPVGITLSEVVENRLIVGYEIANGFPGLPDGTKLTLSIELIPENGGTRLELRQGPLSDEIHDGAVVGWAQTLDKLASLVATPERFRTSG